MLDLSARPPSPGDRRSERGGAIALLGFLGASVVVTTLLMSGLTQRIVDRSRAQAAADAAALAGVADGAATAAAIAVANDATLVLFEDRDNQVTVEVKTEAGATATASAERRLGPFAEGDRS